MDRKKRSELEENELEGITETELARLQRQYRIMDNDRKAYYKETQTVLRKQRRIIDNLMAEKAEIDTDMNLINSNYNTRKNKAASNKLSSYVGKQKQLLDEIETERQQLADIESRIRRVEREIPKQAKRGGANDVVRNKQFQLQKKARRLDNRLYTTNVKFNSMLVENNNLRSEIDHLLIERATFNKQYHKLIDRLAATKQKTSEIIDQATQAYDQRDEANSKAAALRDRNTKESVAHMTELKDLLRTLDHDHKLKEFMSTKAHERQIEEDEEKLKKKDHEKSAEKTAEETVQAYREAFRKIRDIAGETDVNNLIAQYVKMEDKNFALFNYVNELNTEVETLQEQIAMTEAEIEKTKQKDVEETENKKEQIQKLEREAQESAELADQAEQSLERYQALLRQLCQGVDQLVTETKCDRSPILELLGDNQQVTENNIMTYLTMVEQRVNDLLRVRKFIDFRRDSAEGLEDSENSPSGSIASVRQQSSRMLLPQQLAAVDIKVAAPSPGDESEAESDAVPLTEDQIKEKMAVQAESAQASAQDKKKKHQRHNSAHGTSKPKPIV
ncbi:coiled-coil domain-containing protein 63-like [Amphibalanus amphitrite]|uniref:coiled-coil domain-containing protein 63-like n=1 Tax=Amphibalanus amphitrite TaxID=1232801 RepID=UPI001C90E9B9|nr:coiled-coil domain-containing protein 63-like [Amphibalanus amphitrite]